MAKKSPANSNKKNSVKKNNAAKKATAVATPPPVTWQQRLGQEVVALLLLGLALFLLLALASYSLADPQGLTQVWSISKVGNWAGKAGALLAWGGSGVPGVGSLSPARAPIRVGLAVPPPGPRLPHLAPGHLEPGPSGRQHRSSQPGAPVYFLGARPDPQRRLAGECAGRGIGRAPEPSRGRAGAVPGLPAGAHGDHPPVPGGTAVPPGEGGPAGLAGLNQPAAPPRYRPWTRPWKHPRSARPSSPGPR